MAERLVLNRRSGKLHRVPTREQCNVDQIPKRFRVSGEAARVQARKQCKFCFPKTTSISKGYKLYA